MLDLREGNEGITIKIRARPKSRSNSIRGVRGDALLVSVTAPPEKGKANKAIIDLLARHLKLPKSSIELLSGETHSEKIFRIYGITRSQFEKAVSL